MQYKMNLGREIRMTDCFIIVLNVAADGDGINATAPMHVYAIR